MSRKKQRPKTFITSKAINQQIHFLVPEPSPFLSALSQPFPPSNSSKKQGKVHRESSTNLYIQPQVRKKLRRQIHKVSE